MESQGFSYWFCSPRPLLYTNYFYVGFGTVCIVFNVTALEAAGPATQFWTRTPCWSTGAFGRQQIAEGKQENEKMKESEVSNPFLVLLDLDVILAKGGSCGKAFLHWEGERYSSD